MDYKKTGAQQSTVTRDLIDLGSKTGNIFKSLAVVARRSYQINSEMKDELINKLEEFATNNDQLEEVFENTEQIAVSRYYERLPKPWAIALKELMQEEIYIRNRIEDQEESSQNTDA